MHTEPNLKEIQNEWHGSYRLYAMGFIYCMVFTCTAFFFAATDWLPKMPLILMFVTFALVQAFTQLLCFLHVGQEAPPRWETLVFCFMTLVLLIIVVGSLWIMYDLNDRVMSGMDMEQPMTNTEVLERHHQTYMEPAYD